MNIFNYCLVERKLSIICSVEHSLISPEEETKEGNQGI